MSATNPTLLAELAERCEKATGPDYDADYQIALETGWQQLPMDWRMQRDWKDPRSGAIRPSFPRFTASLDAAMSLVPEGCGVLLQWPGSYVGKPWAHINLPHDGPIPKPIKSEAATPALALVAAALRAHMKEGKQ